jgi:hypothetical protein
VHGRAFLRQRPGAGRRRRGAPADPPTYGPAQCENLLLFQTVEYGQTDAYLPPGFHPRDSQGFLRTPVAFGQGAVVFMVLQCTSTVSGPLHVAFLGIFVEAPSVKGLEPAPYNFFELARYGQPGEFGGALVASHWPWSLANVTIQTTSAALRDTDVIAVVADGEGTIAQVAGTVAAPVPVGDGPTRFWRQDDAGLAYVEYGALLDSRVGPGICSARQGTPLAAFVGQPIVGPVGCIPADGKGDPVVAVLAGLQLNATFHRLPGEAPA